MVANGRGIFSEYHEKPWGEIPAAASTEARVPGVGARGGEQRELDICREALYPFGLGVLAAGVIGLNRTQF